MKAYIIVFRTRFNREKSIIMYARDIKEAYEALMKESNIYELREIIKIIKSTILNS